MPHATANMGEPSINGDMPSSQFLSVSHTIHPAVSCHTLLHLGTNLFLQHLNSYPVVHDSVSTFKNNPYGAKGIDLTNATYTKFVRPTLPFFKGPYSWVAPYVSKADELGDKSLSKIEEKVPIVKSETKEIQQTAKDVALWPLNTLGKSKEYVLTTYSEEYKKCGGDGLIAGSKAAITSSLVVSADILSWVSSLLKAKKDEARDTVKEKTGK